MTGQTEFTRAVLDPGTAAPGGLVNPDGVQATKRFDVYRNNVAVSLTEALEGAFPVIRKLIGETNFKTLAGVYLRRHPPASPLMMFYGHSMPDFLETFEPVQSLPYLADVARLEQAQRQSYHAADATPIDPEKLQSFPADQLMAMRLEFAPAMQLIRSRWPAHAIWRFNMEEAAPKPGAAGENVLITRPDFDPEMTTLAPGGGVFVETLMQGATFGTALDAATGKVAEFDLTATLGVLITGGAITKLNKDT